MRCIPPILTLVARVATISARYGKWAGVCGEAAADPVAAAVFVGLGVHELSVGVGALVRVRQATDEMNYRQSRLRSRRCLKAASGREVRQRWAYQADA